MAIIDCPKCGKKISDRAPGCVHCEGKESGGLGWVARITALSAPVRVLIFFVALVIVLVAYGFIRRVQERADLLRVALAIPEQRVCAKSEAYAQLLLADSSLERTYGEEAARYKIECDAIKAQARAVSEAEEDRHRVARTEEEHRRTIEKQHKLEVARKEREEREAQDRKKAAEAVTAIRAVIQTAARGGDPDIFNHITVEEGLPSHLRVTVKPIWHRREAHLRKNDLLVLTRSWERLYGPKGFVSFYFINGDEVGGRKMFGGLWVEGLD